MALVLSPVQVRDARACVREMCAAHHVTGDRCDDAQLAISELVGNALRHGRQPIEVEVSWTDSGVLMSVADSGPLRPHLLSAPSGSAESGRGLQLVQAVARSWGCDPTSAGKRVWALV